MQEHTLWLDGNLLFDSLYVFAVLLTGSSAASSRKQLFELTVFNTDTRVTYIFSFLFMHAFNCFRRKTELLLST